MYCLIAYAYFCNGFYQNQAENKMSNSLLDDFPVTFMERDILDDLDEDGRN